MAYSSTKEYARIYAKNWRARNPERLRKYRKELYQKHRLKWLEFKRIRYITSRKEVLKKYGNRCKCCGETNFYFLTLDHINSDGYIHRKSYKGNMFTWARTNNYPKSLRILCFNCNSARHWYGGEKKVCPHKFKNH